LSLSVGSLSREVVIGSNRCKGAPRRSGRPIKRSGRWIKNASRAGPEFNQQLDSSEAKPGISIKRYERAIILFNAKGRHRKRINTSST